MSWTLEYFDARILMIYWGRIHILKSIVFCKVENSFDQKNVMPEPFKKGIYYYNTIFDFSARVHMISYQFWLILRSGKQVTFVTERPFSPADIRESCIT